MPKSSLVADGVAAKTKPIPLLDLSRQYAAIREEVLAAIERVCASQQFILGPEVVALEHEIAELTGAEEAVGCASGTDALWLALTAAGIARGDRVITTPFSFFASASAIVRCGAEPLFVDIDSETLNLDPAQVNLALRADRNVHTILPVHLYGQCADWDALQKVADEFGIPLIEDAAQAIGAKWGDRRAGSLGVSAAFSF